ncbi:MAG: hypothetical protein ABEI06_02810, partial [Halobacteriaceae archaeon]
TYMKSGALLGAYVISSLTLGIATIIVTAGTAFILHSRIFEYTSTIQWITPTGIATGIVIVMGLLSIGTVFVYLILHVMASIHDRIFERWHLHLPNGRLIVGVIGLLTVAGMLAFIWGLQYWSNTMPGIISLLSDFIPANLPGTWSTGILIGFMYGTLFRGLVLRGKFYSDDATGPNIPT